MEVSRSAERADGLCPSTPQAAGAPLEHALFLNSRCSLVRAITVAPRLLLCSGTKQTGNSAKPTFHDLHTFTTSALPQDSASPVLPRAVPQSTRIHRIPPRQAARSRGISPTDGGIRPRQRAFRAAVLPPCPLPAHIPPQIRSHLADISCKTAAPRLCLPRSFRKNAYLGRRAWGQFGFQHAVFQFGFERLYSQLFGAVEIV